MAAVSPYEDWIVSSADGVAEAALNRPQALNAQRSQTFREMHAFMDALSQDPSVRVLILRAEGRAFSAGADLKEYAGIAKDEAAFRRFQEEANAAYDRLVSAPFPAVAAVHGAAFGGGLELALHADLLLVAEEAKLGLPEIRIGMVPGGKGIAALIAAAGPWRAAAPLLTGEAIAGAQAVSLGIAAEAMPAERLLPRAREVAARIAECAPLAVRATKKLLAKSREAWAPLAAKEREALLALFRTADAKEGVRAFAEKRPPRFEGR